jgi:tetratricopeptide (TPR) repeat protein
MTTSTLHKLVSIVVLLMQLSCKENKKSPASINALTLDLKRGEVISCGPVDGEVFGTVSFEASVPKASLADFNMGIALLHSFEYDESEKMFAKVIDQSPGCAMAYWGVAMSNLHTLWAAPMPGELEKGKKAIEIARSITDKTERESDYINALGKFYEETDKYTHRERLIGFEKAMEGVYTKYNADKEATIFYALSLNAAADPTDKTYSRQKKAISILMPLFETEPMHPGVAHYIIHNSDYPELAAMALPAARKYASIAPASSHALHMPSHIFTRLGLWDECIQSNSVAQSAAQCYAEQAKLDGHWDEELHVTDYLVYGHLQKGQDKLAKKEVDYLLSFDKVEPLNFKTAYTFAASPARYLLERKQWKEAANYIVHPANFPWDKYPWQKGLVHFTRMLGAVNTGDLAKAKVEWKILDSLQKVLESQKEKKKEAAQVAVQVKTAEAWISFKEGSTQKGIALMEEAARMEDGMEKHPVTPGEIVPARELLGEMLLQAGKPNEAVRAFELSLANHNNRFNSLYGAAVAAMQSGQKEKAMTFLQKISSFTDANNIERAELQKAKAMLSKN